MLFYRAALPLSRKDPHLHRRGSSAATGGPSGRPGRSWTPGSRPCSCWPTCAGETFAELAAGFGVGTATAWRYIQETVALLSARAPKPRKAVRDAKKAGYAYVVLDGTLIPIDPVAADRPFRSGKHKRHGMNLQVIASPDGDILWVSGALPGSAHDKKAEWIRGVLAELEAAGLVTLADKGYLGSTHEKIPYRGKNKPESQKTPTRPTPSSAPPAKEQTRSPRTGGSSASSAAAPGAQGNSQKPSTIHAT
jgi:hypothetical protein